MIVLMLRLGLRAKEVAALQLEDIDWRTGQVTVHGKRARIDQLPLPTDVGTAIAGYLQRGRPRTTARAVFIRTSPPPVGVSRSAVSSVVRRASTRAGLETFGAHRLRHTTACHMLRAGGSLVEIGQVLRHDSLGSTARYARVDVERLRTIARAWPTGSAS
jgi:site-specific recombinase XerD